MQRTANGKVPSISGTSTIDIECPTLGKVPSPYIGTDPDLVIKASITGITFLQERRYKKRYMGSKTANVDINGELWTDPKAYAVAVKGRNEVKKKVSKKKSGDAPPDLIDPVVDAALREGHSAISSENPECANFTPDNASKKKKKSYSINKREVRHRVYGYINTQKGKKALFFWTVTFPEGTPDDTCYRAFNTWLTMLRKYRMLKDYLWVAERQDGKRAATGKQPTNTLHFHIAIPHYMDVHKANNMMRGTLKNLAKAGDLPGAICSSKGQYTFLPCIARYNGVDICKHKKTGRVVNFAIKKGSRALATYLTKYVTKNNAGLPDEDGNITTPGFEHLAWHNSRGFSILFTGVTFTISEFKEKGFGPFLNRIRVFSMNFAKFVPWLFGPPPLLLDHLYKLNSYIQTLQDGTTT